MKSRNLFFNAHHAPMGAFASFTLGCPGATGGLGLEDKGPADQDVYVGVEEAPGSFAFLPFFKPGETALTDFAVASPGVPARPRIRAFGEEEIARDFNVATDTWTAGDLTFRVVSPVFGVPDPETSAPEALALAVAPAVLVELTLDNTRGEHARRLVFGLGGRPERMAFQHLGHLTGERLQGVVQGRCFAVAAADTRVRSAVGHDLDRYILGESVDVNLQSLLGEIGVILTEAAPGTRHTVRLAVCFFREGRVTTGMECRYLYRRFFDRIEDVAAFALRHYETYAARAAEANGELDRSALSPDQHFMLAHAVRSYYGATQLLEHDTGSPVWVVNEGEYRMMNTFDLAVDQLWYELKMNPWTVRNVLDLFAARYSYRDEVRFPGEDTLYPGGVSFTHDMGVGNAFSRPGWSAYERTGCAGCFSHMTHEQLVNFVLCACVYAATTGDRDWLAQRMGLLADCLTSLEHRDHPDPARRDGIMDLDSSRCGGEAEITTYDSLDASLGQARRNLYLAVKSWAAYVLLEKAFADTGRKAESARAGSQADRCAATVAGAANPDGWIPAVLEDGSASRIIPAIEGLIFPVAGGVPAAVDPGGRFGELMRALKRHVDAVLRPGICLFEENGGYRISSTSTNSWLSKIYLSQHILRSILGRPWDETGRKADAAHVGWLLDEHSRYFAWSDQMVDFKARGSKYYPRGVTACLWLQETAGRS